VALVLISRTSSRPVSLQLQRLLGHGLALRSRLVNRPRGIVAEQAPLVRHEQPRVRPLVPPPAPRMWTRPVRGRQTLCWTPCVPDFPLCAGSSLACARRWSWSRPRRPPYCAAWTVLGIRLVGVTQELFLDGLVEEIRDATSSREVYPSPQVINARLLRVAATVMKVTEEEAAKKLQEKMLLPVRKPANGMALVLAYLLS